MIYYIIFHVTSFIVVVYFHIRNILSYYIADNKIIIINEHFDNTLSFRHTLNADISIEIQCYI